ncbi:ALWAYS EARLY 2 [Rhynchospora pubera]|uniref:ALWAYS EARLY 2 n=1 Tax=Rhynchospora pubera TaxID=906938 RepID=A0AAV8BSJ2_9POAL|nr:ALWAYS EARLY 2 [Rhynchospora pubera]
MASTRKGRKVHKKFAKVNEDWAEKEGPSTANKGKNKKRKLVDLLGPQWSKEELERFYDAYRKYGKDWKKVSGSVRNRTADMAEALYNMNRAYLSLPEGAATAAGLIAMMTDHYSNLEGSNSENEDNELLKMGPTRPPPKRGKGKQKTESKASKSRFPDLLSYEPASSSFAALSAIKKKRSGGTRPRAVGKRTPRVAVASIQNRANNRLGSRSATVKHEDDEGAHVAAMALAEVFQRGGSPQVSHTPSKYAATIKAGDKKNAESERDSSKAVAFHAEGEGSLGSREAENEASHKGPYTPGKGVAAVGSKTPKSKKSQKKKQKGITPNREDDKEACSGTEEGHHSSSGKGLKDADEGDAKSPWASTSSRKRSRQLFFEVSDDEAGALSALHTLADLSVNILQPTPIAESESSAQGKDDNQEFDSSEKQSKPKASSKNKRKADGVGPEGSARKKTKVAKERATPETKDSTLKPEKAKKRKPTPSKIQKDEAKNEIEKAEVSVGEEKLGRRPIQASPAKPAGEFVNPVELSPSISGPARVVIDVSETSITGNPTHLQIKSKSRRKSGIVKAFSKREIWRSENTANKRPSYLPNSAVDLKDKLSHCLSNSMFRRWCRFEWFYSAIDYPWFAQNEFVEYLNHVKLGHIPRLTREEWGVIRGSLGKPRRLSAFFLKEERVKLAKYRQSVREHYSSLLTGKLEGLPTDLARPLTVGQRVIACHPKSRELHDGSVLTVDGDRCRVQFDRPELGVEFVLDIDCLPSNPVENIPEALRRQNVYASKFGDSKFAAQANDWRAGVPTRVSQSSEGLGGPSHTATSYPMNTLLKQAKQGDSIDSVAQAKATLNEATVVARQAMYNQSSTMSQIQEREADIRAIAELSRALDKKEALLMELRYMNEEVSGKQKETDNLSDLEHFRNQYATVLVQLREANDQVASALLTLRQRNTYIVNPANPLPRSTETYGAPPDSLNNAGFNNSQDAGSQVVEIIENSRRKAKMMVDAAVQVMCTTSDGEDPLVKIGEALDSLSNRNFGSGSSILGIRRIPPDSGHANSTYQQENATSATFDPSAVHAESPKMRVGFEGEVRLPSELISSCVSTLLMIQSCTEKQQPPAEVAHILDSALASMQPCCPDNAGLYREIETCMGIIKNQMLALIPTPAPSLPLPVPLSMPSELPSL